MWSAVTGYRFGKGDSLWMKFATALKLSLSPHFTLHLPPLFSACLLTCLLCLPSPPSPHKNPSARFVA